MWVMNPKLSRVAHDLLLSVALNCNTYSQMDREVINNFIKLRFKNKPNINHYLQCTREIANGHPNNLPFLVKMIIFNELSNNRNTNNMHMLCTIFATDAERAAKSLASVFLELLCQKDDYLRALRMLFREIVKALRQNRKDINLQAFCLQLMHEKPMEEVFRNFEFKERIFIAVTDLICLAMYLALSPSVRDAFAILQRGEKKDVTHARNFMMQVRYANQLARVF